MKRQDTLVIFINQFIVVLKALKMHKKIKNNACFSKAASIYDKMSGKYGI